MRPQGRPRSSQLLRRCERLAGLEERVWLVIDDVHEQGSSKALQQLELLVRRAPPEPRFVLATRHDVRLGLHHLRLEDGRSEIRAAELRFSLAEAAELLATAGVELPVLALLKLNERTEGWAAGLRLAALSLAGHPDPGRFAAKFSGGQRTVAEYRLAEVFDRQPEQVRRLLLHTSILESVTGEAGRLVDRSERLRAESCRIWRRRTRSWSRSTWADPGSDTTAY